MKLVRTAKIKLDIPKDELLPTLTAYTKAFNTVCQVGYDSKDYNGVSLHHKTYKVVRGYLPAQLAISARMKATEALKSVRAQRKKKKGKTFYPAKCPQSKLCSIRYDVNSYSLFIDKQEVSLLTVSGRKRYKLHVPDYFKHYFTDWTYRSADLVLKKRTQQLYLHIVFEKEITDIPATGNLIGIDRGINNLAVTSTNNFYGGGKVKRISNRYLILRAALQSKGSASAKRHLRKLSGRERRFKADINHQIAKQIVEALKPGDTIVLENLSGIRNRRLRKKQRAAINSWNFYQLEQFIIYKAAARGIKVVFVDPRYTSQRCSKCGHIEKKNREAARFCCKICGFKHNADLNAAKNICLKYLDATSYPDRAAVNQPIVSVEISDTSPRLSAVSS